MTLIPKAEKVEFKAVSLKLPALLVERLDRYAELVGRDRSQVAAGLIEYALDRDEEFAVHEGRPVGTRRRRQRVEAGIES